MANPISGTTSVSYIKDGNEIFEVSSGNVRKIENLTLEESKRILQVFKDRVPGFLTTTINPSSRENPNENSPGISRRENTKNGLAEKSIQDFQVTAFKKGNRPFVKINNEVFAIDELSKEKLAVLMQYISYLKS